MIYGNIHKKNWFGEMGMVTPVWNPDIDSPAPIRSGDRHPFLGPRTVSIDPLDNYRKYLGLLSISTPTNFAVGVGFPISGGTR